MIRKIIILSTTLLLLSCGGSGDGSSTNSTTSGGSGSKTVKEGKYGIETAKYSSTIVNNDKNMTLEKKAIGIYSVGTRDVVNNTGNMTLGESAIGIYSNGGNTINNAGTITVGKTDVYGSHDKVEKHRNSVGIYVAKGAIAKNTGTIIVKEEHSIGAYVTGEGTSFTNFGTIEVDNGGVGIVVRDGAVAINKGDIILGAKLATCGATTVGMSAAGKKYGNKSTIINDGTITVNQGVGMLVGKDAEFKNNGTIIVNNGIGIQGIGSFVNAGEIKVNGGKATSSSSGDSGVGSVVIDPKGDIKINSNYRSSGGTLSTDGDIIVDGAYVDVTTGTPLFNANNVSGEINILPNFALTGNGISYKIENFVKTASGKITGAKLTAVASPLFVAKVTDDRTLVINKRAYADFTIGDQFDALDKGLDNILANSGGIGKDADILKGLNAYLGGLPSDQFERKTAEKLGEARGDIYSTIQGRIQNINKAFDNSFYELESSYNTSKDSSKYSAIYTDGNYKNSTVGIDDYDYKVMGFLYMKENEEAEHGNKYGYTLGFAGSKFDFDDGGSTEEVYSLRAGAHRLKNLSSENKVSWLSRAELGYNRHIAERKLNLHETFENEGEYNSYSVSLDNRVIKSFYTDLSRELSVYGDLEVEYGRVDNFTESTGKNGGLELEIKDNDYLSAQAGLGVKASQRIYAGNKVSLKLFADVKYAYELGENYDGNKARLKNGGEGYYSLITPEKREGILVGKVGLTVEKENHMGLTFEVEMADEENTSDDSIKYGVRANYKF